MLYFRVQLVNPIVRPLISGDPYFKRDSLEMYVSWGQMEAPL